MSSLPPKMQAPQFKMPNVGNWIGITAIGVAIAIAYITVKATIQDWDGRKTVLETVIIGVAFLLLPPLFELGRWVIQFSRSIWEKARSYDAVYDSAAQLTAEISRLTALGEENAQVIRLLDEQVNQQKERSEEDEIRIEELSRTLIISQSFNQHLWILPIDRVVRRGDTITFVFAPSSHLIGGEKALLIDRQTGSVLAYLEIVGPDERGEVIARTVRVLDLLYWTEIRRRAALSSGLGADIIAVIPPEER